MTSRRRIIMSVNLKKLLLRDNFYLQILSVTTLFIISFFYIFWAGSFFEADIFPFENRVTYSTTFNIHIFEKYLDTIVIILLTTLWFGLSLRGKKRIFTAISYGILSGFALFTNLEQLLDAAVLISIPVIISFFVYHFSTKKIIQIQTNLLMSFFSLAVLCIAVSGLIVTIISISSSNELPRIMGNHATDIFILFSSFSPLLIFLLLIGSFIKLFTFKTNRKFKIRIDNYQIKPQEIKQKNRYIFLSLFILLSIFIALLPHQSFINLENELVGADTIGYGKWLSNMPLNNNDNFVYEAFVGQNLGDRPLSLILFSSVLAIFPEDYHNEIIDHLSIILLPLLVVSVFFLSREITKNDYVAICVSFLTAISFHSLIGIYGGLYANWLALIFGYSSFVFLFRFLKKPKAINYLLFSILFFSMMLSHTHTWTLLTIFISIFLIVSLRFKMYDKKFIALIFLIIISSIAIDSGKSIMTDARSGIEFDVIIANDNASYLNPFSIWSNLSEISFVYGGGVFGNFLILALCIFWLVKTDLHEMPNLFIAIFLAIGFFSILFGGEIIQSRVLFNIPFQIPAAIGLVYLTNLHRGTLLSFSLMIWILIMAINAITNFI